MAQLQHLRNNQKDCDYHSSSRGSDGISLEGFVQNFKTRGMNFTTISYSFELSGATTTTITATTTEYCRRWLSFSNCVLQRMQHYKRKRHAVEYSLHANATCPQLPAPSNYIPQEHNIHIYIHTHTHRERHPTGDSSNFHFFHAHTLLQSLIWEMPSSSNNIQRREEGKKNNQYSHWLDLHFILLRL